MAENNQRTPIQIAWLNFVKSVQVLLGPQVDDRPLDQYLAFRDDVLSLVQSEQFLAELQQAWTALDAQPTQKDQSPKKDQSPSPSILNETGNALRLEIEAFRRAIEVAQATTKPEEGTGWMGRWSGRASTVVGSVKDIMKDLPPYAKNALTLYKELIDLFKGKDS